jgi:carboxypeptidase Taq
MQAAYEALCDHTRTGAILDSINALLGWDERTKLPLAGGKFRAEQMKTLAGMIHVRRTDPRVGDWLSELEATSLAADLHSDTGATIAALRRDYDRNVKLPTRLVEALAAAMVEGQQVWQQARNDDCYADFAPQLGRILGLVEEKAEAIGYEDHKYDALLDEYEPGAKTREISNVLTDLVERLSPMVAVIRATGRAAPIDILRRDYDVDMQARFGRAVAKQIGFDFRRGRLDVTSHPFCESSGPDDCRITTRYDKHWFAGAFFGTLHEAGHGIYEQGLVAEQFGLPLGQYVSLGIHESQSRMWENFVGRGHAFWNYFFPKLKDAFPESLDDVSIDDFFWSVNSVRPSLIRVEADEATYNLHIAIRFELERDLIGGLLSVDDLPIAWNEKYEKYLGVTPPSAADGVLQDIHWSSALMGYFPTYALGNLYAAQFFEQAQKDIPDLDRSFQRGEFTPLKEWLGQRIHREGRRYSADELVKRVTGRPLGSESLLRYLHDKLHPLFGLDDLDLQNHSKTQD